MPIWQIWESQFSDGSGCIELGLKSSFEERPAGSDLSDVVATRLVKEFEAETYNQACQIEYDHFDWGVYKPME